MQLLEAPILISLMKAPWGCRYEAISKPYNLKLTKSFLNNLKSSQFQTQDKY